MVGWRADIPDFLPIKAAHAVNRLRAAHCAVLAETIRTDPPHTGLGAMLTLSSSLTHLLWLGKLFVYEGPRGLTAVLAETVPVREPPPRARRTGLGLLGISLTTF